MRKLSNEISQFLLTWLPAAEVLKSRSSNRHRFSKDVPAEKAVWSNFDFALPIGLSAKLFDHTHRDPVAVCNLLAGSLQVIVGS
jgi:hypothetical protein